jgi:hypothetical protein
MTTATMQVKRIVRDPKGWSTDDKDWLRLTKGVGRSGFIPEESTVYWTARSIWKRGDQHFELLYDRQDSGGPKEERVKLANWVNEYGLDEMLTAFRLEGFDGGSSDAILIQDGEFAMAGKPNASHGYAYLCAWIEVDKC